MKHNHPHFSATKPRSPRFGYVSLLQRRADVVSTLGGSCAFEAGVDSVT